MWSMPARDCKGAWFCNDFFAIKVAAAAVAAKRGGKAQHTWIDDSINLQIPARRKNQRKNWMGASVISDVSGLKFRFSSLTKTSKNPILEALIHTHNVIAARFSAESRQAALMRDLQTAFLHLRGREKLFWACFPEGCALRASSFK